MQIAIKCWENSTSLLYLDFTVMTFQFASDNFIHLVAEKHPPLIRYYWTKHLGFLVTIKWGKEIIFFFQCTKQHLRNKEKYLDSDVAYHKLKRTTYSFSLFFFPPFCGTPITARLTTLIPICITTTRQKCLHL